MSLTKRVGLLAGTAALSLTSGSLAGTGADTDQDLEARLAAAEAKIAELTASSRDSWLTEQRAEEIRGIVQDVLADADTRASLLNQGVTAGYDNGAVLGSSDGNWLLRTNLHMQQRYIYNNASSAASPSMGGIDENRSGFENTRTKLIMTGHVVNPDWFFRFDHNFGSSGLRDGTLNAYLGYNYGDGWKVKMGSMKAPLLREELVESQYQLAVERSLVNYAFTGGYVDGIAVSYEADQFRVAGAFTDGANSGQSPWSSYDTEWSFTIRGEFLAMGTWDQFTDFTSPQGSEQGLLIGAAIHYQNGEYGTGLDNELEVTVITIDGSFEADGWNLYGAWIFNTLDNDAAGLASIDADQNGFLIQGGVYLAEDFEIYGRYEWADFDASGVEDLGIFTIGVNKYFAGHNAKWSTDLVIGIDEIDSTAMNISGSNTSITGLRPDDPDEDGQVALRTQFSIFF